MGIPQSWEEEFPQNLTKNQWGKEKNQMEKPKNPAISFKGGMHRLTCSQTLTLGTDGGSAAWEAQETHEERLSCVPLERGLEGQLSSLLSWAPFWG